VCYDLAKKHPEQLMMMDPPRYHVIHNGDDDLLMAEAAAGVERTECGLNTFLLKPKDLKGESFFKYMVQHRLNDARANRHAPSMYLGVEYSEAQVKECGPDAKYLRKSSIMSYEHVDGSTVKPAARNLDNIGYQVLWWYAERSRAAPSLE
jgi:hypothetical protein